MTKRRAFDDLLEHDITEHSSVVTMEHIEAMVEKYFDSKSHEELIAGGKLLPLLYVKFGMEYIEDLRLIFSVVPVECGPWRKEIIIDLLQRVRKHQLNASELKAVDAYLQADENGSHSFSNDLPTQHRYIQPQVVLEKMVLDADVYGGCICPPTSVCYECGNALSKNNKPSRVTLYTLNGPLPMKKIELRCRHCNIYYGIVKFGNKTDGYHFYATLRSIAEASDVSYIERTVMSFFTSLR